MPKLAALLALAPLAACAASPDDPALVGVDQAVHGGFAFPPGPGLVELSQRWWRWIYAEPAAHNPMFDLTGADCALGQRGEVFFLASVVDPGGVGAVDRACRIPAHEPILVSPSGALNDFPCPDPAFHPAPGQSLYDFLRDGLAPIVDAVDDLGVTLDGAALADPFAYRVTSRHLFLVDGDASLATVLDGCITGAPQPAVSDGYFMLLRGLDRGAHTLAIHAADTHGTDVTITYALDVH